MIARAVAFLRKVVDFLVGELPDLEERRKRAYVILGMTIVIPALTFYGLSHLVRGNRAESLPVLGLAALLAAAIPFSRRLPSILLPARFVTGCAFLALLWEIGTGGGEGFAFLWAYMLPIGTFFVFGAAEGRRWVFLLLVSVGAAFSLSSWHYGEALITRFLVTFVLVVLLCHALESARAESARKLSAEKAALEDALGQVNTLTGLLPICAHCKNIRDDKGYWGRVEQYIAERTDARFSHGICPDCTAKFFPEVAHGIQEKEARLKLDAG